VFHRGSSSHSPHPVKGVDVSNPVHISPNGFLGYKLIKGVAYSEARTNPLVPILQDLVGNCAPLTFEQWIPSLPLSLT